METAFVIPGRASEPVIGPRFARTRWREPGIQPRLWISGSLVSLASRNDGLARAAHLRQQLGGGPRIRRQAVFDLHRLHRSSALLAHDAVDLADIEARA